MNQQEIKAVMATLSCGDKFKHRESFALMTYQTEDKRATETIWNSRDGVTPFGLSVQGEEPSMDGLQHIHYGADRCIPWHVPNIGARIFVDSTPEHCRKRAVGYVAKHWEGENMAVNYDSLLHAVEALTTAWHKPGAPVIVTVTAEIQKEFVERLDAFQALAIENAKGQA